MAGTKLTKAFDELCEREPRLRQLFDDAKAQAAVARRVTDGPR